MENITVRNFEKELPNPNYVLEVIGSDQPIRLDVWYVSQRLSRGYGTWSTDVELVVNGHRKVFTNTHHNEDWYTSNKDVYNQRWDSDEEAKEMMHAFQASFEAVIDYHEDAINSWIKEVIEEK